MNEKINRIRWQGRTFPGSVARGARWVAPLEPPDCHHLAGARGWLGLGNCQEARADLDRVQRAASAHPDVLEVRCQVGALSGQWGEALELSQRLTQKAPDRAIGWLYLSASLDALQRTQEAYDTLFVTVCRFPREALMRYSLACLASKLGLWTEASAWLKRAFDVGDAHRLMTAALNDPDLKPLWGQMGVAPCRDA